jgi:hypothetical protein
MGSYLIVNTENNSIYREPSRSSWESNRYASEGAAKAGITRTVKYYQKALDEVAEVEAQGKPDYTARNYNAARDAKKSNLTDRARYRVMHSEEYALIEPMITTTGICPGSGKEITHTASINEPYYLSPLSESYWSA